MLLVSGVKPPPRPCRRRTFVAIVVLQLATEHRRLSDTVEQNLPGLLPRLRAGTRHSGEESGPAPRTLRSRTSGITDRAHPAGATAGTRLEPAPGAAELYPRTPLNERAGNGGPVPGHSFE
ncbi:hypothetical protein [Streptomyces griseoluteus]|uniref:hypothetical protein n=1 Tax=Streptomyces griseoluteus TaxID=29306 RepID=UPI00382FF919